MIGVYDYTVILTYASLVSGILGIVASVTGTGHPVVGLFFLMLSGVLDAFDGRVARMKKDRSEIEKNFGVQIDSLCDMICFGVLPITIGLARLRVSGILTEIVSHKNYEGNYALLILLIIIAVFYVLAAMIRLAYFNSTIEIREGVRKLGDYSHLSGFSSVTLPATLESVGDQNEIIKYLQDDSRNECDRKTVSRALEKLREEFLSAYLREMAASPLRGLVMMREISLTQAL